MSLKPVIDAFERAPAVRDLGERLPGGAFDLGYLDPKLSPSVVPGHCIDVVRGVGC